MQCPGRSAAPLRRESSGERIYPDDLVASSPGSHRRKRVCRGEPDHSFARCAKHPAVQRAAMIAAPHCHESHLRLARAIDRRPHGEGCDDLPHRVVAVDDDCAADACSRPAVVPAGSPRRLSASPRIRGPAAFHANECRVGRRRQGSRQSRSRRLGSSLSRRKSPRPRHKACRARTCAPFPIPDRLAIAGGSSFWSGRRQAGRYSRRRFAKTEHRTP